VGVRSWSCIARMLLARMARMAWLDQTPWACQLEDGARLGRLALRRRPRLSPQACAWATAVDDALDGAWRRYTSARARRMLDRSSLPFPASMPCTRPSLHSRLSPPRHAEQGLLQGSKLVRASHCSGTPRFRFMPGRIIICKIAAVAVASVCLPSNAAFARLDSLGLPHSCAGASEGGNH